MKKFLLNSIFQKYMILDLLFFPYIRLIKFKISFILLLFTFYYEKMSKKEFFIKIIIILLIVFSFLIESIFFKGNYFKENIVAAGLMVLGYLNFYYYKNLNKIEIVYFLKSYMIFNFILAILYQVSPSSYFEIRRLWTLNGQEIEVQSLLISRFTGILSEPNNCATISLAIGFYLLYNKKTFLTIKDKFILPILLFIIVFSTMSSSGLICLGVFYIFYFKEFILWKDIKKIKKILFLTVGIVIFSYLLSSSTIQLALERYKINSGDSRFQIWKEILENSNIFYNTLIGRSGVIIENKLRKPHNGHLYLIYSYGLIFWLIFIYNFFLIKISKWKKYLFLFPILFGFTINTVVLDIRYFVIWGILIGDMKNNRRNL